MIPQEILEQYPPVRDEFETLDRLVNKGKSIARYGDGELNLCRGRDCISQSHNPEIEKELRNILRKPNENCIVGIPNIHKEGPKHWFWNKVFGTGKYLDLFSKDVDYYSSFITRPDSAPWIDTMRFWSKMELLWRDQEIILVTGSEHSFVPKDLEKAKSLHHIKGLYEDSYYDIDRIEREILDRPEHRVFLCLGPTATILANRIAAKGKQGLDLGHVGRYLRKVWKYGQHFKP